MNGKTRPVPTVNRLTNTAAVEDGESGLYALRPLLRRSRARVLELRFLWRRLHFRDMACVTVAIEPAGQIHSSMLPRLERSMISGGPRLPDRGPLRWGGVWL